MTPDIGRPYFRAVSALQPLALLETDPSSPSEDGSTSLRWWTRSQRIRTVAEVPLVAALVETLPAPVYLQIAGQARQLRGLGLAQEVIARELGVSAKTVAKSLRVGLKERP